MVVILLGPPGVGKGTQAALAAETLGWEHVSTGDLLRAARREGTELGRQAQSYMDRGELVPDELILAMVKEHLGGMDRDAGVLLDGFPRTVVQAEALEEMLPAVGRRVDRVLLFNAPDEVLVKRIAGRRTCSQCGAIFNVYYSPPAAEGRCDECGGELVQRADDNEETVRRRLQVYLDLTKPLVAHYEGETQVPLVRVDADRSVDEIQKEMKAALS